jgi:hypothetical protein
VPNHVRPNSRTAAEIEQRFNRNIVPILGHAHLSDLHKRDVNRVLDPIPGRDCPVEASHCFEDLHALVRWGVRRGNLDHNVTDGLRKPHQSLPRERALTDNEIRFFGTAWARCPSAASTSSGPAGAWHVLHNDGIARDVLADVSRHFACIGIAPPPREKPTTIVKFLPL